VRALVASNERLLALGREQEALDVQLRLERLSDWARDADDHQLAARALMNGLQDVDRAEDRVRVLDEVAKTLDEMDYEYLIVGWYHSHPGFTTFLSEKDLETQKKNFSKPYHATIVIDPVNKQFRSYKVVDDRCVEKRFSLFEQSPMERELTEKRRKEILAYIDEVVQTHFKPPGQDATRVAAGPVERAASRTRLPDSVRQTIEEDIKQIVDRHKRGAKKD